MDAGEPAAYESCLVDLTGLSLDQLRTVEHSTLAHAIRRVLQEADDNPEVLAAFQNQLGAVSAPPPPDVDEQAP